MQEKKVVVRVEELIHVGFRHAGNWKMHGERIKAEILPELAGVDKTLYAFVVEGEVKYIGKTVRSLKDRMANYRSPGPSQRTNYRINPMIAHLINRGTPVEIYALPDDGSLEHKGYHINLAAGLEDSLISRLDPPWNGGNYKLENLTADIRAKG